MDRFLTIADYLLADPRLYTGESEPYTGPRVCHLPVPQSSRKTGGQVHRIEGKVQYVDVVV